MKAPPDLMLKVAAHVARRSRPWQRRVFFPRGDVMRAWGTLDRRVPLRGDAALAKQATITATGITAMETDPCVNATPPPRAVRDDQRRARAVGFATTPPGLCLRSGPSPSPNSARAFNRRTTPGFPAARSRVSPRSVNTCTAPASPASSPLAASQSSSPAAAPVTTAPPAVVAVVGIEGVMRDCVLATAPIVPRHRSLHRSIRRRILQSIPPPVAPG